MAENTPNSFLPLGNTTEELAGLHGKEKQLVVDTTKNTLVVMDGTTLGGHPLAKEGTKIKSGSEDVLVNDGTEANLAEDVTIKNKPWGVVLEGEFPTDEEELAAIAARVPVGGSVYGLAPDVPEDSIIAALIARIEALEVKVNEGIVYNDEILITESGDFAVPYTGYFEVTAIGGGNGANTSAIMAASYAYNGNSGATETKYIHLTKGEIVPVTIGAGAMGSIDGSGNINGGVTSFGDYVTTEGSIKFFARNGVNTVTSTSTSATLLSGEGIGGNLGNGQWYGAGGGVEKIINGTTITSIKSYNGAQGCVILRGHNPDKN